MLVNVGFTVTVTLLVIARLPASLMVTVKVYVPAALKVTVVFFEVFVAFALKIGAAAPLGIVVAAHVYLSLISPPSSAPRTESCVFAPVTGFAAAAAAVTTRGAALARIVAPTSEDEDVMAEAVICCIEEEVAVTLKRARFSSASARKVLLLTIFFLNRGPAVSKKFRLMPNLLPNSIIITDDRGPQIRKLTMINVKAHADRQ